MPGNVVEESRYQVGWDALLAEFAEDDQGLGIDPYSAQVEQLLDPELVWIQKTFQNDLRLLVHQGISCKVTNLICISC